MCKKGAGTGRLFLLTVLCASVFFVFSSCAHDLTAASLSQRPVIGALGIPLGTVTDVTATLVADDRSRSTVPDEYLLRVTRVADHQLAAPQVLPFHVDTSDLGIADNEITIASNAFDLYSHKTGTTVGTLDGEQITALNKEFLGKSYRLTVYEEAALSGFPRNPPPGVFNGQGGHEFGCTTSLVVLGQTIRDGKELNQKLVGETVSIEGEVGMDKAWTLYCGNERIQILGVSDWPTDAVGRRVTVVGRLGWEDVPATGPSFEQKRSGGQWYSLTVLKWSLVTVDRGSTEQAGKPVD